MTNWTEQTRNTTTFTNNDLESATFWGDEQSTWGASGVFWGGGISWIPCDKSLQLLLIDDTYLFEIDLFGHNLIIDSASEWTNLTKN